MSPEQAGFSGVDIDTRADIYSLGVILYELLTGLRPIDAKRLKEAALTEMIRIIREEEPSKPSTRLSTDESLPSMAALRQTEPRKLMALLRGELDWVVMKCLEKSASGVTRRPTAWHATSSGTSPMSRWRRGRRRRDIAWASSSSGNKGPVDRGGSVLLALLAGIAGTTYGLIRAEQARRRGEKAEGERLARLRGRRSGKRRSRAQKAEARQRAAGDHRARQGGRGRGEIQGDQRVPDCRTC